MKKTVMFLILTVGLLTAACQKEAPLSSDSGVGFSLGRNIVEVPAEGGTASVYWVVEKPIEGETLRIFKEVEWIHNIDTSVEGELRFEVEPTDLEVDSREAVVTVSYGEETGEFTVIQAGMEPAISFSVVMSTPTSIVVCVEPEDESMNYFANVVEKEIWETYKSDEDVFAADIDFFTYLAEMSGMSLAEWLSFKFDYTWALSPYIQFHYVNNGENGYRELIPGKEYMAYCYGIDGKGEVLSNMYVCDTGTENLEQTNPTEYELIVDVKGSNAELEVIPSDDGQMYCAGIYPLSEDLDENAFLFMIQRMVESNIFVTWSHPNNTSEWEDIAKSSFYKGRQTLSYEYPIEGQKGVCYAYSVDDMGCVSGKVYMEKFVFGESNQ